VKIEPAYEAGATVYVTDASRAVGVVGQLLGDGKCMDDGLEELHAAKADIHRYKNAHGIPFGETARLYRLDTFLCDMGA